MTLADYYVVWFDRDELFTLVDSSGDPITLSAAEVKEDLDGLIVSDADATSAREQNNPQKRYGITENALELLYGVYL